jgi:hypothetical protein
VSDVERTRFYPQLEERAKNSTMDSFIHSRIHEIMKLIYSLLLSTTTAAAAAAAAAA